MQDVHVNQLSVSFRETILSSFYTLSIVSSNAVAVSDMGDIAAQGSISLRATRAPGQAPAIPL